MTSTSFRHALPVWEVGTAREKNLSLLFTASIPQSENAVLRIAAHASYILKINGHFLAAGPARAGHGFYRVDEYAISARLTEEVNVVSVLCAGYNVNSFCYLDMPSFLCCEVTDGGRCLAATGKGGFIATRYTARVQRVERYSFQRTFAEAYIFDEAYDRRETDSNAPALPVNLGETEPKRFITREVYYPEYEVVPAVERIARGAVTRTTPATEGGVKIGPLIKGYADEELTENTLWDALALQCTADDTAVTPAAPAVIPRNSFVTYRLPKNLTGFLSLTVTPKEDASVYVVFDEVLRGGRVDLRRLGCANVVVWHLKGGCTYRLMTVEPYTLQYMNVIVMGGAAEVAVPAIIRYDFPEGEITHAVPMPDETLRAIYDAAVETFRQNTLDIYMDCPSRERAGWLCDSFFTSRTEYALTGRSTVEHAFLDNFLMAERFEFLPEGMLPMCYPADHNDGVFIPNWAMWFVPELAEYLRRTGDRDLVDRAKARVYGLLAYFRRFENSDGLLERLESWVFIEWSRSNALVQDISYPTNMLYAKVLETVAALYGDNALAEKAAGLKETIRRQSFMGDFFCDNAVYGADGKAVLSREATESCQYYAFFTEVATPETHPALWNSLVRDFGPQRKENNPYPHVAFANSFIGNYLRLELLFRQGLYDKVTENIRGYFKYMADKTGTLWEHDGDHASCNHGFASHVVCWLNKIFG